jgi:hypothetical protein
LGRLRANKVAWLTRQRLALLRLNARWIRPSGEK